MYRKFLDEIDEMLPGDGSGAGSGDGGTSQRIFGFFLQWFQNHNKAVFVAATANEPCFKPELFRRLT